MKTLVTGVAFALALLSPVRAVAGEPAGTDVEGLVRKLGSDDFKQRQAAEKALRKLGLEARPALQRAAKSSDPEISARAAALLEEIVWILPPKLRAKLGPFAEQFDRYPKASPDVKLTLLAGLYSRAPAEAEPCVLAGFRQLKGPEARARLAHMLAIYRSPAADEALLAASADGDPVCRSAAARGLGRSLSPKALPRLLEMVGDDSDFVRVAALDAIANRGTLAAAAVDKVIPLLSDASDPVRMSAVRAAGRLGDRKALEKLWELCSKGGNFERAAAVEAAGQLIDGKNAEDCAKLAAYLRDPLPVIRAAAANALGEARAYSQAAAVAGRLLDADATVSQAAGEAVTSIGTKAEIPQLRNALMRAPDGRTRGWAARALVVQDDKQSMLRVATMMVKGKDYHAAEHCAWALGATGETKWCRNLAAAQKRWSHGWWGIPFLVNQEYHLRDPSAVSRLAAAYMEMAGPVTWACFLARRCLYAEAAGVYRETLARNPGDIELRWRMGECEVRAGQVEKGIASLKLAASMDPFDSKSQCVCAGRLMMAPDAKARDYAEALRMTERAVRVEPRSCEALADYAWALHLAGRNEEALKWADEAIRMTWPPDTTGMGWHLVYRARILAALGRKDEALAGLAKALERRGREAKVLLVAAEAYCEMSMPAEAFAQLNRMVALGNPDVVALEKMPELAPVRKLEGFPALLDAAKKNLDAFRQKYGKMRPKSMQPKKQKAEDEEAE